MLHRKSNHAYPVDPCREFQHQDLIGISIYAFDKVHKLIAIGNSHLTLPPFAQSLSCSELSPLKLGFLLMNPRANNACSSKQRFGTSVIFRKSQQVFSHSNKLILDLVCLDDISHLYDPSTTRLVLYWLWHKTSVQRQPNVTQCQYCMSSRTAISLPTICSCWMVWIQPDVHTNTSIVFSVPD